MRVLTAAGAELASLELAASRTFGTAPYVMTPIVAPLVLADPPSACGALHAAPGAVLVAARGDCLFTEKAAAAQRAGAVALLVMNTETGRLAMGGSGAIGIPVFALSKADAAVLRRLMEGAGGAVSAQLPLAPDASASAHSISKLAAFSSRGPAADGRVKPDILAPGFPVISARSDGNLSTRQCGVSQVRRRPRRPIFRLRPTRRGIQDAPVACRKESGAHGTPRGAAPRTAVCATAVCARRIDS